MNKIEEAMEPERDKKPFRERAKKRLGLVFVRLLVSLGLLKNGSTFDKGANLK